MSRRQVDSVPPAPTFVSVAERYATPLPRLKEGVEVLVVREEKHLKEMGVTWQ